MGYLLDQIRLHGDSDELRDEVVRLGNEHGIMTPYTSYLILEKDQDYVDHGITRNDMPSPRTAPIKGTLREQKDMHLQTRILETVRNL